LREVDQLRRFLFENEPLRGHWVRLEESWAAARVYQGHPPAVTQLLGEAMAATSLLAAALKFRGTLTLQITGGGSLALLIAQATHDQHLRAVAQLRDEANPPVDADFRTLVGEGRLVVTVDTGDGTPPWQGIVPLSGSTLAACLEGYFEGSEQLPTRIVLAADETRAAGLLLQKLPSPSVEGEAAEGHVRDLWDEASLLLATVKPRELLDEEVEPLLLQVFGAHDLRLFDPDRVRFQCRCDEERVSGLLRGLGEAEVRSVLEEQGLVTVTCEFCQRPYRFDAIDVEQLFATTPRPQAPDSLN
jgi:molecular chaperone Hsp33